MKCNSALDITVDDVSTEVTVVISNVVKTHAKDKMTRLHKDSFLLF